MIRRRILIDNIKTQPEQSSEAIDLGLPTGLKWARCNIGATKESEYGNYYQWGSLVPYENEDQFYDAEVSVLPTEYDVVAQIMGDGWRMPTIEDFDELISNTNCSPETIDGIEGCKFTSKTDSSKYIFFPFGGDYLDGSHSGSADGDYWSSNSIRSTTARYFMTDFFSGAYTSMNAIRKHGLLVRGVRA